MDATLQQIREFFGMTARQLMEEWKVLDEATKAWYKQAVAEALVAEVQGQ